MKPIRTAVVVLVAVGLIGTANASKTRPEIHRGTLVLLVTPDVNVAYTAAVYLDNSNVAIVDQETSDTGFLQKGCSSLGCSDFYDLVASMKNSCTFGSDVCFEKQSISYYTSQIKQKGQIYSEIGISLASGETMWLVPVVMPSDQFGRELWRNHMQVSGIAPRSPDEWEQTIGDLISQRNAAADKAAYQARVASNLAEIAAEEAAQKEKDCLQHLKAGDDRSKVETCGTPDHINSDLYGDQMVYSDGTIVYVNKASNAVENVQWTH